MAHARPSTSSDEVDIVEKIDILTKLKRASTKDIIAKTILESLNKSGAMGKKQNASHKVMSQISSNRRAIFQTSQTSQLDDLTDFYLKMNRMQQEQNYFTKNKGPDFLTPILAKPKVRLPDINKDKIDPTDDGNGDFENENDAENVIVNENEKVYRADRGTIKPGAVSTIDAEFESFDYTEHSSALRYIAGAKRTTLNVIRVNFNRWPLSFLIGIVTALVALFIQTAIEYLTLFKYQILSHWFQKTYMENKYIIGMINKDMVVRYRHFY